MCLNTAPGSSAQLGRRGGGGGLLLWRRPRRSGDRPRTSSSPPFSPPLTQAAAAGDCSAAVLRIPRGRGIDSGGACDGVGFKRHVRRHRHDQVHVAISAALAPDFRSGAS
jgi:hypothetical protein